MMNVTRETITPKRAKELLEQNVRNRPLRSRTLVERIAADIRGGRWQLNGDTIRLSSDGILLDGQHRLHAIILADTAVETLFVHGLDNSTFETIDTNRAVRSGSDLLSIDGYKNANNLAATAALSYLYDKTGEPFTSNQPTRPTPWQLHDYVNAHGDLVESCNKVNAIKAGLAPMISLSHYTFFFYRASKVDKNAAMEFTNLFRSGAGLGAGSPVLVLRNRLIEAKLGKNIMKPRYKLALVFKTWRLWRDGASIKHLRVREEGTAAESNLWRV